MGKPIERSGRKARCPNGVIRMIDRLQSTRCVLLCSWFFCTHHDVFWPSDSIPPPFNRDVHTPLRRDACVCWRPSGVYADPPARRRSCVCAGAVPEGMARTWSDKKQGTPERCTLFFTRFTDGTPALSRKKSAPGRDTGLTVHPNFDIIRRLYWEDGRKHPHFHLTIVYHLWRRNTRAAM